jgi:type IV secretory pathway VirB4 component
MVIVHFADSFDELERQTNLLQNMSASDNCQLKKLTTQQELAFNSALPLANNQLKIDRALTTECVGVFMPFNSQELSQKNGAYYGLNQVSKNIVIYDRKTGTNYNGFVLGSSGKGKSFASKREMINNLLSRDADVIVIDPENEYSAMCEMLGGTSIEISTNAQNYINPLDLDLMYADVDDDGKPIGDPVKAKSEFILSLCSTVLGGNYGLTPVQNTIIDRCVHNIYKKFEASNYEDESALPTLQDLYHELMAQSKKDPAAYDVAVALELYATGSLDIFAHKTSDSLKVKNNFIVYNILGANGVLKTMSMLIILDSIWNRICYNRQHGRETYFYIDEAHLLFKNKETVDYLLSIYKRCRKYDAGCTCITQNIGDILRNEDTKAMLSNSSFIMLLGQSPLDIPIIAELLNISDTQKGYISNAEQGSGLLIIDGGSIIPIMDKFPKNNHLFKVMTTKISDLKRIEEEEELNKVHNTNHLLDEDD